MDQHPVHGGISRESGKSQDFSNIPSRSHIHASIHTWIQLFQEKRLGRGSLERIPRLKGKKKIPKSANPIKTPSRLARFPAGSLGMFAAGGGASRWPSSWQWGKALFSRFFPRFFPRFLLISAAPGAGGFQMGLKQEWGVAFPKEKPREKAEKKKKIHPSPPEQNGRSRRISSWN